MGQRTITTSGQGQTQARPEQAEIRFDATGDGQSIAVARAEARDVAATVLEALPDDYGRTINFRASDDEGSFFGDDDDTAGPCTATETIEVRCLPEEVGEVIVAATDAGASVRDVSFGLSDSTHKETHDTALRDAMADARRKAEAIAAAENETVGDVIDVSTRDVTGMHDLVDSALEASSIDEFDFNSGLITIESGVEVTYSLED